MLFVTAVLAEVGHTELPVPTIVYGLVALIIFTALGVVMWSFRDVANRHSAKSAAYAKAHGGAPTHGGH
jgi:protein-S-isoprenylcysteine O-methyltransferase Ste14